MASLFCYCPVAIAMIVASAITKGGKIQMASLFCYCHSHAAPNPGPLLPPLVISAVDGGEGNVHCRFDDFVVVR